MNSAVTLGALVMCTLAFWMMPILSRPGIFFGVTVPPDLPGTTPARLWIRRFRAVVLAASAVACVVLTLTTPGQWTGAVLLAHIAVVYSAWLVARRAVQQMAAGAQSPAAFAVHVAALTPRDDHIPGGVLALVGPFIVLAVAALMLWTSWDAIPDYVPTLKRGARGPVPKSVSAVFGPLLFVGALLIGFTLQTVLLVRRTRQIAHHGDALDAELAFKRGSAQFSLASTYLLALGASALIVTRALGRGLWDMGIAQTIYLALVLGFAAVALIWTFRVGQGGYRASSAPPETIGDRTPDSAWLGGLVYFNPSDPSVFVERRMGVGWSPNFGNAWTWVFLIFAVAIPMFVLRMSW